MRWASVRISLLPRPEYRWTEPDPVERQKIVDGMNGKDGAPTVTKVYAQTDAAGTTYHEIDNITPSDVKIGDPWNP